MAKKKSKFNFSQFLKELQEETPRRIIDSQEPRKYFLIVCEGEKTEPNYFNGLIQELPHRLVQVEVVGDGTDTISIVNNAVRIRDKRTTSRLKPPFDEVWAVFDKDEFTDDHFNSAIDLCRKEKINPAYSNEAFELWFILHFQLLESAISRKEYQQVLAKKLGDYDKNAPDMYTKLQESGDEAQAIKRAKYLLEKLSIGNPALEKPTTKVHLLVQSLNVFKNS